MFRLLFLLLPVFTFAQSTPLESEDMRFEAMTKSNVHLLGSLLSSELSFTHSNGLTETKTDFINSIVDKKIEYHSIKANAKPYVSVIGKKSAVINGNITVNGKYEGSEFTVLLKYTSVYVRENKRWVLYRWQSTKIN